MAIINPFNEGLKAAIKLLEGTAADYEQMAERSRTDAAAAPRGSVAYRLSFDNYREMQGKANLLRGQIKHIEALKE
jgi:hypothetical protein